MSRVDELLAVLAPEGVSDKALGDVGEFIRGKGLQKSDLTTQGFPAVHYGQVHTHYGIWTAATKSFTDPIHAAKLRRAKSGDLIVATTSEDDAAVAKATAWVGEGEVAVSGDAYIYRHSLDPRYVAYFFTSERFQSQKVQHVSGTKVRRISGTSLAKIRIPVPPLEVQREIVRVLDQFTQLEAELETELEARRRQRAYFENRLLTFDTDVEWKTLGEIGPVSMCKRIFKSETRPVGDIPFFKIGTFGREPDAYISKDLYEAYKAQYSYPKAGDVLISAAGTIGRVVVFDGLPAYFQDSNIVWIDNDESIVSNAYLRHWYRVVTWATDGGTIRRLYNSNIRRAKIAVPSRRRQDEIVELLDKFDALVNDISVGLPAEIAARRKQYEHYRDKLLTFKEAPA